MKKYIPLLVIFIISMFLLQGCPDSISNPKDIIFPESNVRYSGAVEPFLRLTCAFAGCHDYSSGNQIMLDDYFRIMGSPGLVVPGNPDGSLLIQIIENTKPHQTYFEASNITENHKKGMRKWVLEGANY